MSIKTSRTSNYDTDDYRALAVAGGCLLPTIVMAGVSIAAYITHVVISIKLHLWALLAIGCIVAPVGVIHGIGHWFGAW